MARDEAVAVCHNWMLEFVCYDMWQKFKTGFDTDHQGIFDLSNGVLIAQKYRSSESIRSKEMVFLMLTSSLMSLKKSMSSGDEDAPQQVDFNNILRMVTDLSNLCDSNSEELADLFGEAYMQTLLQRIVACCHQDQYDAAQRLFEETSAQLDKQTSRKVRAILNAKSRPHQYLDEYTMDDYLSSMRKYLEVVYNTFSDQPLMLKHAEYYLAKTREYNGARSHYSRKEITGGVNVQVDAEELSTREEQNLARKLQAIRKRTSKAAALRVENENNNHNFDDEEDAVDGTPEGDMQSGSPRKKQTTRDKGRRLPRVEQTTDGADHEHRSPARQHTERTEPKERSSTEKSPRRAHTVERISESDDASTAEEVSEEETEEEAHEKSLQSRMPLKIKPFRWRASPPCEGRKRPCHQKRRQWTEREEEEFYLAVQKFGKGNWQTIRHELKTDRSNVQLKDKWRNIMSTSYRHLCRKFGPVEIGA